MGGLVNPGMNPNQPSITSTPTFAARAQRSEAVRVAIWIAVLSLLLLLTLIRRHADVVVMREDRLFYPYCTILVVALAFQSALLWLVRRANRVSERLLPWWLWRLSAMLDLATAAALLVVVAFRSPRGPETALSAPPLLMFPLVVLLSVLRLQPRFTLQTGLTAAGIHLLLVLRAIETTGASADRYPVYLSYSMALVITAIAGMFVARAVRNHVLEAAEEAAAREQSERRIFGMQRDLAVARDIQRGLLPTSTPQLTGFEIAGMNRPADQTGGDYYDWQPLPDGRLAVALADVAGHGIGPALVMAVCRAYARATAAMLPEPAALLTRLNTLLENDLPSDRFITFALAVIDDARGEVELISAGHGPTLLYRAADDQVTQFGGDGVPLGVIPDENYGPTTSLTLEEGDVLLMLTDGFFEWARPRDDQAFGIERLAQALRASASHGDAAQILHNVDETVRAFCAGSPQSDDMTAIVIRRIAPARPQEAVPAAAATPSKS